MSGDQTSGGGQPLGYGLPVGKVSQSIASHKRQQLFPLPPSSLLSTFPRHCSMLCQDTLAINMYII